MGKNATDMKSRLSPSTIKRGSRCSFAAALSIMKNPDTGLRYQEAHGARTKDRMCEGIYFESLLTGKQHEPREGDGGFYEAWQARLTDQNARRIRWFADCAKVWLVRNEADEIGRKLEVELPDFILNGEADYIGGIATAYSPNEKVVLDSKFASDIGRWDFDRAPKQQFLQAPTYSLLYALLKPHNRFDLFTGAITQAKMGNIDRAAEMASEWGKTTEILPAAYLIVENKEVPEYQTKSGTFIKAKPHMRMTILDITPIDMLKLYFFYMQFDDLIGELVMHGNKYDTKIAHRIGAGDTKCNGTNFMGEHPGRCPMNSVCEIGRRIIGGNPRVGLSDIEELTN